MGIDGLIISQTINMYIIVLILSVVSVMLSWNQKRGNIWNDIGNIYKTLFFSKLKLFDKSIKSYDD